MRVIPRINEIVDLLQAFALSEIDLTEARMTVALRLLDWAIDDAPLPPDGGEEVPVVAGDSTVVVFPSSRVAA